MYHIRKLTKIHQKSAYFSYSKTVFIWHFIIKLLTVYCSPRTNIANETIKYNEAIPKQQTTSCLGLSTLLSPVLYSFVFV